MNVWSHLPTIFSRRNILRLAGFLAVCVAITTTLLFASLTHATAGINKTLSFQGRLLSSNGAVVPDGHYNIQFKIYQDGDGTAAGDTGGTGGTLKWTESYINNGGTSGVNVKDGFFSVELGANNPFGSSVDWNQDTLWLSMNIAGTASACTAFNSSPCTADGEMLPMKRITSTPYALNSGMLGGITSSGFLQNTTTPQTADFNITGTGIAATLQGGTSLLTPVIDTIATNGTLDIAATNASTINVGTRAASQTINIGTSTTNAKSVSLGSTNGVSTTNIQGGGGGVNISSTANIGLGTNGGSQLNLLGNGDAGIKLGGSGNFNFTNSSSVSILSISDAGAIATHVGATLTTDGAFTANGTAYFGGGVTIQGTGTYVSPNGSSISSVINIPNFTVPAYGNIIALGLPSSSAATARGILVADARTVSHQATIGVLSPDENNIMGLSWSGSNSTGLLANTANTLALQGNGLNLLTATNASGAANVGIGNSATSGYALDVTGDINSSTQYRIGGVVALSGSALAFTGASDSSVTSATSHALDLNGSTNVVVTAGGATSATFSASNVQIGTGSGSGAATTLTLDKASSAPTGIVGSMYYDTAKGEVQCYEATGWGNCSAAPDNFVSLSPTYANAVVHPTGTGTLSNDLCSDALNINDGSSSQPTVCGTNETYNYYNWTSASGSAQTRSIYVTYQLPSSFKNFVAGSTSLKGRTDGSDATVAYQVYKNTASGLTACGSAVATSTGSQSTWQTGTAATTADPSNCTFAAGDSIVFKVDLTASNNANAYAGTLNFAYSNNN